MRNKFLCFLVLFLLAPMVAYGAVAIQDDGTYEGEAAKVNFSGDFAVAFSQDTATVTYTPADDTVEIVTATSDTVLTTDDNTTFVTTASTGTTDFTLPTAAVGLRFRFAAGVAQTITIDPASTFDTIKYLSLDGGDALDSAATSGDSIEIVGAVNTWYVVDTGSSAWTDGGAN